MLNQNNKELKKLEKISREILTKEKEYQSYSQDEIKNIVSKWKSENVDLDKILIDAFALCREITTRILGKSQYKVQLIGGIVLTQGRIAEMKTGEGKTLTELCPAFLNAIAGKGVHILTVNDYLCERDFEEMRGVFEYAGLTVGLILNDTIPTERKKAYACDITYTTNTEVGFDYLRDNTVLSKEDQVLRGLNYVIIDELDSVLIDDAKTPLILAREVTVDNTMYLYVTSKIKRLKKADVNYNIKENYVVLTDQGVRHIESLLNIKNFSWNGNSILRHIIIQCLKAKYLFKRDKQYIIADGEVVLIDVSTGRIAEGRKLSDGLHQAIEAKENVTITNDTITIASITYQNFFKLYTKVSGMSGTIATEVDEMKEFYELDVVVVPTNKPTMRRDEPDVICENKQEKYKLILEDVERSLTKGLPILVGTTSIKESEELSNIFTENGIDHRLLNAKTKKEEAEIISRAGEWAFVTIATNIAGRGTDIKISEEINQLGGLRVIATERNIARRIDNQLIGRSGRQGNNGSSIFYLSPEDELFKEYSSEEVLKKAKKLKGESLLNYVLKNIHKSQKIAEYLSYDERKEVLKRDYVVNLQREVIYKQRQEIIEDQYNMGIALSNMIFDEVSGIIEEYDNKDKVNYEIGMAFNGKFKVVEIDEDYKWEAKDYYSLKVVEHYNLLAETTTYDLNTALKQIFLVVIDREWIEHTEILENLKRTSAYQNFMQVDPFLYYRKESGKLFEKMLINIRKKFLFEVFYNLISQLK